MKCLLCLSLAQLGVLQKEPLGGGKESDPTCQTAESSEHPRIKNNISQQNQSGSADETQTFFNINFPGKFNKSGGKCIPV